MLNEEGMRFEKKIKQRGYTLTDFILLLSVWKDLNGETKQIIRKEVCMRFDDD